MLNRRHLYVYYHISVSIALYTLGLKLLPPRELKSPRPPLAHPRPPPLGLKLLPPRVLKPPLPPPRQPPFALKLLPPRRLNPPRPPPLHPRSPPRSPLNPPPLAGDSIK